jgi:hypothetical protein
VDLEHEYYSKWDGAFQRVLADIGNLTQYNTKPTLETWFDIIKRVMRLKSKMGAKKQGGAGEATADVDDFYVYLYDEEDTNTNQG